MAANNYFGFTHAGTQYSQQPAGTYAAQTAAAAHGGFVPQQVTHQAAAAAGYAPAAARNATAAATGYEQNFQAAAAAGHTTAQYAYSQQRAQDPPPPPPAGTTQTFREGYTYAPASQVVAASYEKQAYYQQPQAQQSEATAYYQQQPAAKTGYSTSTVYAASRSTTAAKSVVPTTLSTTYAYPSTQPTAAAAAFPSAVTTYPVSHASASYSGYDAAVYSAATTYYQQQQAAKLGAGQSWQLKKANFGVKLGAGSGGGGGGNKKDKPIPKPPQLHYCEICKISCAGPQTYREHLEGQKHKKKEALQKAGGNSQGTPGRGSGGTNQLRCELCDVTCTGADAYAAHLRGAKHQKVLKLHTKLGKPIPSTEPVIVNPSSSMVATMAAAKNSAATSSTGSLSTPVSSAPPSAKFHMGGIKPQQMVKKVAAAPKITFIGGSTLKSTGSGMADTGAGGTSSAPKSTPSATTTTTPTTPTTPEANKVNELQALMPDVLPVGEDYIEEVKSDDGKIVSFNCKLCDCKFNDPNAKEMHMKGRRHRLQYKKKVNPDLQVDVKPSVRARRIQEERMRKQIQKEEYWRQRQEQQEQRGVGVGGNWGGGNQDMHWREEEDYGGGRHYEEGGDVGYWRHMDEEEQYWEERRRYDQEMSYWDWERHRGPIQPGLRPPNLLSSAPKSFEMVPGRRPDSYDDRHVMAKHSSIYPTEEELQSVQNIVSASEKALKLVSDFIAENDGPQGLESEGSKQEAKEEGSEDPVKGEDSKDGKKEDQQPLRTLKGVMRVGVLAKGLLLRGDMNVNLVVLCAEKPTRTLLERVGDNLPKQLANVSDQVYETKLCVEEAAILVSSTDEPRTMVTVTLTSPIMREQNQPAEGEAAAVKDPPDVLDRQKCLSALAALRHAKWFQARAGGLHSCVVVIRILRDLCNRVPTWGPLKSWAMELLVERVISSANTMLSPGDALRHVFEAISSGILLPGGPGIHDPCEKDLTDAVANLTSQECEDITASAQHALRLIAFRQIFKVLGMDPLPTPPRFIKGRGGNNMRNRKRRRDNSEGGDGETEVAEGKKDKKDGEEGGGVLEGGGETSGEQKTN